MVRRHAWKRVRDPRRYNTSLSKHDLRTIERKIREGGARFIQKCSNQRSMWEVDYQQRTYIVIYDSTRHALVTFLNFRSWMGLKEVAA